MSPFRNTSLFHLRQCIFSLVVAESRKHSRCCPVWMGASYTHMRPMRRCHPMSSLLVSTSPLFSQKVLYSTTTPTPPTPPNTGTSSGAPLADNSPAVDSTDLAEQVVQYAPHTWKAISQVMRSFPEDLQDSICQSGGLRRVLERRTDLFLVSSIGGVLVARKNPKFKPKRNERPTIVSRAVRANSVPVRQNLTNFPPKSILRWFPRFLVPLSAIKSLIISKTEAEESSMTASAAAALLPSSSSSSLSSSCTVDQTLKNLLAEHSSFLSVISLSTTSCTEGEGTEKEKGMEVEVEMEEEGDLNSTVTFVKIDDAFFTSVNAMVEKPKETSDEGEKMDLPYPAEEDLASEQISFYEPLRVARLLPSVSTFYRVDAMMRASAAPLLPEGRDLVHVLLSAPHLFDVEEKPLRVRFKLHANYIPNVSGTVQEIQEQLRQIQEMVPIRRNREKRRSLRRQIQYLTDPTPFLDQDVLAMQLFDTLPGAGEVCVSHMQTLIPIAASHALPGNLNHIFHSRPHMFRAESSPTGIVLCRADTCIENVEEDGEDGEDSEGNTSLQLITSDIIISSLYDTFVQNSHPREGCSLARIWTKLPRIIQKRLKSLRFVEDVLLKHPDKIEVLPEKDNILSVMQLSGSLQKYRFVGSLQQKLIDNYALRCARLGVDPESTPRIKNQILKGKNINAVVEVPEKEKEKKE